MHAKKVFDGPKENNKVEILDNWSILKEKKQECLQVFYNYHTFWCLLNFQDENTFA
jgi:hypothetical protein